ncbi:pyridoxamine 5'-phosphate oxidase family protein, partial [Kitasatospora sp. NPDC059571]
MYHAGERAVQQRAGLRERAEHTGRSIGATIPPVAARFLTERRTLVVGAADGDDRLWATQLAGAGGLLRAEGERSRGVAPPPGGGVAPALAPG